MYILLNYQIHKFNFNFCLKMAKLYISDQVKVCIK